MRPEAGLRVGRGDCVLGPARAFTGDRPRRKGAVYNFCVCGYNRCALLTFTYAGLCLKTLEITELI